MHAFVPSIAAPRTLTPAARDIDLRTASSPTAAAAAPAAVSTRPRLHPRESAQRVASSAPAGAPALGARPSRLLHWFHADLRLDDNEALRASLDASSRPGGQLVLALFAPPPPPPARPAKGGEAEATALLRAAHALRRDVAARGGHLLVLPAHAHAQAMAAALVDVCDRLRLEGIAFNRATAPRAIAAQRAVAAAADRAGLAVEAYWGEHAMRPADDTWLSASSSSSSSSSPGGKGDASRRAGSQHAVLAELGKPGNVDRVTRSLGAAPDRLPGAAPGASAIKTQALPPVRDDVDIGVQVRKTLVGMRRDTETLAIEAKTETCVLLRHLLDCGAVSPRAVLATVRRVVGAVSGHTAAELAFRTATSLRVHAALGVTTTKVRCN